jgi:hypothetical protein
MARCKQIHWELKFFWEAITTASQINLQHLVNRQLDSNKNPLGNPTLSGQHLVN